MQESQVWSLIQEDPTCCGANKFMHHNYWAHMSQLLKPERLEPVLHNNRSLCKEKSAHLPQLEKSPHINEDPAQPKVN